MKQLAKRLKLDYSRVLGALFDLMLASGIQPADLTTLCNTSIKRAERTLRKGRNEEVGGLSVAALVLDAWHRDRRYLTIEALPKPVKLLGTAPSVEALIRAQGIYGDARKVAKRLKALRLIEIAGKGRYTPRSDAAVISAQNPLVLQHALQALSTLLQTVGQNVTRNRPTPLIERVAEVPDLPRRHVEAFQEFTQTQGRTFLRTINDWLELRRSRKGAGTKCESGTVRAGVHTYAYVVPKRRTRGGSG